MQAVISKSAASLAGAVVPAKAGATRKSVRAPVVCATQPVRPPAARALKPATRIYAPAGSTEHLPTLLGCL